MNLSSDSFKGREDILVSEPVEELFDVKGNNSLSSDPVGKVVLRNKLVTVKRDNRDLVSFSGGDFLIVNGSRAVGVEGKEQPRVSPEGGEIGIFHLSSLRGIEDSVNDVSVGVTESFVFLNGGLVLVGRFSEFGFGFEVVDQVVFFAGRGSESFESGFFNFFLRGQVESVNKSEKVGVESFFFKNLIPFSRGKSSWDFIIVSGEESVSPEESSESFEREGVEFSVHLVNIEGSKSAGENSVINGSQGGFLGKNSFLEGKFESREIVVKVRNTEEFEEINLTDSSSVLSFLKNKSQFVNFLSIRGRKNSTRGSNL